MARKNTLKVNKIEKPKNPIHKYMIVIDGETVTLSADDFSDSRMQDDVLEFYIDDEVIAIFKDWKYFIRIDPENKKLPDTEPVLPEDWGNVV